MATLKSIEIENRKYEKLLQVKINSQINFTEHRNHTISKTSRKANALSRITSYMNIDKKRILMNSFFLITS